MQSPYPGGSRRDSSAVATASPSRSHRPAAITGAATGTTAHSVPGVASTAMSLLPSVSAVATIDCRSAGLVSTSSTATMLGTRVRTGSAASSSGGGSGGGVVVVGVAGAVEVGATVVGSPALTPRRRRRPDDCDHQDDRGRRQGTGNRPRRPHSVATGWRRAHPAQTVPDHSTATKAPRPAGSTSVVASTLRLRIAIAVRSGAVTRADHCRSPSSTSSSIPQRCRN